MKQGKLLLLILIFLAGGKPSFSQKDNGLFERANQYYQDHDYNNALKAYQKIAEKEPSAELMYNIGNCYFKTGNLGKSILYYERAAKLNPEDEDISFNLKVASLKTVDKIEPVPAIIYKRWLKAVVELMTMKQWSVLFIIMSWLAFAAWAIYLFSGSVSRKKVTFFLASGITFLGIVTWLFLNESYHLQSVQEYGVVMQASSYVKSAPDEKGNDQFILHEGTRVELLDELGPWKKIRIANGSVGWLKGADIEVI